MQRDPHMDDHYADDSYYARFVQPDPHSPEALEDLAREEHEARMAISDRAYEKGDTAHLPFRHHNRRDRADRREAKDERRARALLRPHSGQVEVQSVNPPLDEAA